MAWSIEGQYFENCSCEVLCPCTASLALGADYDTCDVALVFHIDSGDVEGVDVSGLTVAAIAQSPKVMSEGNWKLGVLMDAAASEEQAQKLGGVFSGELGGPMEALAGLIGENLGMEQVPIEFSHENGRYSATLGDKGTVTVDDVVPFGSESGEAAVLTNIFHPAGSELTVAKGGDDSTFNAFGLDIDNSGKSGFSASKFAWAA